MPPEEHSLTSVSATGETVHGPAVFCHDALECGARGRKVNHTTAQEALEKLCRTYWRPIYGYVRRRGAGSEDAEDLTQGFFALLLERKDLKQCAQGKRATSFVPAYVSEAFSR